MPSERRLTADISDPRWMDYVQNDATLYSSLTSLLASIFCAHVIITKTPRRMFDYKWTMLANTIIAGTCSVVIGILIQPMTIPPPFDGYQLGGPLSYILPQYGFLLAVIMGEMQMISVAFTAFTFIYRDYLITGQFDGKVKNGIRILEVSGLLFFMLIFPLPVLVLSPSDKDVRSFLEENHVHVSEKMAIFLRIPNIEIQHTLTMCLSLIIGLSGLMTVIIPIIVIRKVSKFFALKRTISDANRSTQKRLFNSFVAQSLVPLLCVLIENFIRFGLMRFVDRWPRVTQYTMLISVIPVSLYGFINAIVILITTAPFRSWIVARIESRAHSNTVMVA